MQIWSPSLANLATYYKKHTRKHKSNRVIVITQLFASAGTLDCILRYWSMNPIQPNLIHGWTPLMSNSDPYGLHSKPKPIIWARHIDVY